MEFAPNEYKVIYESMVEEVDDEVPDKDKFSKLLDKVLDDTAKAIDFANDVTVLKTLLE